MSQNNSFSASFAAPNIFGKSAGIDADLVIENKYYKQRLDKTYRYPASYKQALMHRNACEFGYNSQKEDNVKTCACCELAINTVMVPLCYGTTPSKGKIQIGKPKFMLDAGSTMFFTFIKLIIVYLLVRLLIVDSFNIITNLISYASLDQNGREAFKINLFAQFSIYSKQASEQNNLVFILDILNLTAVVVSIVLFYFIRKYQINIFELVDSSNLTQGDYTVFVQKIPIMLPVHSQKGNKSLYDYEAELKKVFETRINEWKKFILDQANVAKLNESDVMMKDLLKNVNISDRVVSSVSLCFDLTEMQKISAIRDKLLLQIHGLQKDKENAQNEVCNMELLKQIDEANQQFMELSKRFGADNSRAFNLSHFVGNAFVSFQYQFYAKFIYKESKFNKHKFEMFDYKLKIDQSAEPSDVYWYNMKVSDEVRNKSVFYSFILLILCLGVSFTFLFMLQVYQIAKAPQANNTETVVANNAQKTALTKQMILSYIFTIVMATLIALINIILAKVVLIITQSQKHLTKTLFNFSLIIKNTIVQFVNSAVIYFIICVAQGLQPLGANGIVTKVTSLVTVTGFVNIALNFLQIGPTISQLMRRFKYRNFMDKPVETFQLELNKQVQKPQFAYSQRYAYYLTQVYIISFYGYIAPYAVLVQIGIFFVMYWIDKLNLFRRSSSPTDFGFKLTKLNIKLLEFSLLIFTIGNFIFGFMIHNSDNNKSFIVINSISLGLALFYCVFTIFLPSRFLYGADQSINVELKSFSQCIDTNVFKTTYWQSNPGTSYCKQADVNHAGRYVKTLKEFKLSQESDYNQFIRKTETQNPKIDEYSVIDVQKANVDFSTVFKNILGNEKLDIQQGDNKGESNVMDALFRISKDEK